MLTAIGSVALVGGAGLGVDTVQWYLWKRQLQQAVDAGALAGAYALARHNDYVPQAKEAINKNANTSVTIQRLANPPTTGAYAGRSDAVEVLASTQKALPFSSLFVHVAPAIEARAVATTVAGGDACVVALAGSGTGVDVAGTANVQLGCGVSANSVDPTSIYLEGTSYLNGSPLTAVGGITMGSSNVPSGTQLVPYTVPQTDPLASRNLQVPSSPSGCTASALTVSPKQTVTLSPGRYCNGLALKGDVTLSPGVYIIDQGSFDIASMAHVVGDGVTIVLTGNSSSNIATVDIAGGSDVSLTAPTAAQDPYWKNILFFQDPRASSQLSTLAGGSSLTLTGVVYMPSGNVSFSGSSGQYAKCLLLVANRVQFTGTSSIDNNCSSDYSDIDWASRNIRVVE